MQVFAHSVRAESAQRRPLAVGRSTDHNPGPGANIDPIIGRQLLLRPNRNRTAGNRVSGGSNERPIGGVQVLDPPAAAVGGQLGLASADAGIRLAIDLWMDIATMRDAPDQDRLLA